MFHRRARKGTRRVKQSEIEIEDDSFQHPDSSSSAPCLRQRRSYLTAKVFVLACICIGAIVVAIWTSRHRVSKANPLSAQQNSEHIFTYLSPTFDELLIDFEAAEKRWTKEGAVPSTAEQIAQRYGIPKTILSDDGNRCNANGTTAVGWIPCTQCDSYRAESGRISRYIFQTWATNELTPSICDAASSWSALNPEYDYFLFDDETIDTFIRKEYGLRIYDAYKCVQIGAAKADIMRLLVIYIFGGIYFDLDSKPIRPFRTWGFGDNSVVTGRACEEIWWLRHGCAHQWGMIYERHHPVIRGAIVRSLKKLAERTAESPYDLAFWSFHLSWAEGPYNQSYMPGWDDKPGSGWKVGQTTGMGGRVIVKDKKSADDMDNGETNKHWVSQYGRKKMWKHECLKHAPPVKETIIPSVCKSSIRESLLKYLLKGCAEYCNENNCERPKPTRNKKTQGKLLG